MVTLTHPEQKPNWAGPAEETGSPGSAPGMPNCARSAEWRGACRDGTAGKPPPSRPASHVHGRCRTSDLGPGRPLAPRPQLPGQRSGPRYRAIRRHPRRDMDCRRVRRGEARRPPKDPAWQRCREGRLPARRTGQQIHAPPRRRRGRPTRRDSPALRWLFLRRPPPGPTEGRL